MTVHERLARLQKDAASGKKLTPVEAQSETLAIINAAKKESLPHLVRMNSLLPMISEAAKEAKQIREDCDQCADVIRSMLDQEVSRE